jgi:putative heme iron utilization protein
MSDGGEESVDGVEVERTPGEEVRAWLEAESSATLSTLATEPGLEGFPIGSLTPFALDGRGRPLLLIADISAHSKDLTRDPRGSLFVRDPRPAGDPQATWRVALLGRFERLALAGDACPGATTVDADEYEELLARYAERVPAARRYLEFHPFHLWRMHEVERARSIAGFGRIHWVEGTECLVPEVDAAFAEAAAGAVEHMNADHAGALVEVVRGLHGHEAEEARMVSLDRRGYRVHAGDHSWCVSFGRALESPEEIRGAVVETLRRARAAGDPPA